MYRCFILDDEPLAVHVIEQHLAKFSMLTVCGTSTDPVEALPRIKALQPDLLFVDIQMPDLTGLELITALRHRPAIIVTTAFREYAVEGFDLDVLDYLVKPIPFVRFAKAIEKFLETRSVDQEVKEKDKPGHIMVKADRKTIRIRLDEIMYVEGVKDYVKIVLPGQSVLTKISIGHFRQTLPEEDFIQVHKSFIVAKDKITAFTAHDIEIGKTEIPIGRSFREQVMVAFGRSG